MHDLIIIGTGPAGLTAALYAGRYRLNTLLFEKMVPGGQIILSPIIENFPGFPGGIPTQELVDRFRKQVEELNINIESDEVVAVSQSIKLNSTVYNIKTKERAFEAKSVIIAIGALPKRLGLPQEEKLTGRGVSYCAVCDGPLFKDKDIVVVGGGNAAMEEAILLCNYARKVNLIHRRSVFRASKILEERARNNPKMSFILDSTVEEILGQNKVEAVKIRNVLTNAQREIPCHGVFVFVGIRPNTDFLNNFVETNREGFIITDELMKSSRAGIFACGDCRQKSLYQVVTACSDGAIAADSAYKYIKEI